MASEPTSLTVPGTLDHIARIRNWLEQVLRHWHVTAGMIDDLKLAVTELCMNIVRHGYTGGHSGNIDVSVSRHRRTIRITIDDTAPAFEPGQAVLPPPESLQEGGYGLYLIHSLIDDLRHERLGREGNRFTLIKYERLSDEAPDVGSAQ